MIRSFRFIEKPVMQEPILMADSREESVKSYERWTYG